jgi:hypothetical protein
MAKTYAVHYGNGHLSRCKVLDDDFTSLKQAKEAAQKLVVEGYGIVIVTDTDGNEWDMTGAG